MRTVAALTPATTISTGCPATTMSDQYPRTTDPPSITPAPAAPICVIARLRDIGRFMPRMLTQIRRSAELQLRDLRGANPRDLGGAKAPPYEMLKLRHTKR